MQRFSRVLLSLLIFAVIVSIPLFAFNHDRVAVSLLVLIAIGGIVILNRPPRTSVPFTEGQVKSVIETGLTYTERLIQAVKTPQPPAPVASGLWNLTRPVMLARQLSAPELSQLQPNEREQAKKKICDEAFTAIERQVWMNMTDGVDPSVTAAILGLTLAEVLQIQKNVQDVLSEATLLLRNPTLPGQWASGAIEQRPSGGISHNQEVG